MLAQSQVCLPSTAPGWLVELLRPEAFPHRADNLRVLETRISWVVLAGSEAYKFRKPVDFGFLNFSTLAKRRKDCDDEVQLNARLCPDLYLGVVDVVVREGQVFLGGDGVSIEPAVRMRRLPESGMLPAVLERGSAGERLVVRIAERLAGFHAHAATGPGVDEHGSPAQVRDNWNESLVQIEPFIGRTLSRATRDEVGSYVERFLGTEQERLEARVRDSRIRDGHGDLHTGSVCVAGRRLYLFDCVEFNARLRCADVAADVAFLAMDLDHLGYADLGHAFVDAYMRIARDPELLALLNFYKCYRAFVRGTVLSSLLDEPGLADTAVTRIGREAGAYFDLARTYAHGARQRVLVVTMGLPASGKTTLARALAGRLAMVHLSSDVVRKRLAGVWPSSHRSEQPGRGLYSSLMSRRTYAAMRRRSARWLRRGQSVVIDAIYGQRRERAEVRHLARRTGVRFLVLECRASEAALLARLAARQNGPASTSEPRVDQWPALRAAYTEPKEVPEFIQVDTTRPLEDVLDEVVALVLNAAQGSARAA